MIGVVARRQHAGPQADIGIPLYTLFEFAQQYKRCTITAALIRQTAANAGVLVDDADLRARVRASQRGGQAGRARADHQHIAKIVAFPRAQSRHREIQFAQSCEAAEYPLPEWEQ